MIDGLAIVGGLRDAVLLTDVFKRLRRRRRQTDQQYAQGKTFDDGRTLRSFLRAPRAATPWAWRSESVMTTMSRHLTVSKFGVYFCEGGRERERDISSQPQAKKLQEDSD